jgi:hypothetical protein
MSKRKPTANVHPLLTSGERPKRISQCSLLLSPYPSLGGGFAQIFRIECKIDGFIPLKIQKISPKRAFWAKPSAGEGTL